jgi:Protein of unknown function (DUF4019)
LNLKPLLRNSIITSWSDQQIELGSKPFTGLYSELTNSMVVVLLVSPDFLGSNFVNEDELGPSLKKAEETGVNILWVPVRDSAYKQTPLKDYQAVVDPTRPLAGMTRAKRDKAWVEICETIQNVVNAPRKSSVSRRFPEISLSGPAHQQRIRKEVSASSLGETNRQFITSVEFVLERPLAEFDVEKFKQALKLATGIDASQIRIAAIRPGSTIVKIDGEQETLASLIRAIQTSQEVVRVLATSTGMREIVWEIDGRRYELTIAEVTDDVQPGEPNPAIPSMSPVEHPTTERERGAANSEIKIDEVILLLHGIRDFGEWEQKVASTLEELPGTKAPPLSYGRFDAFRFWFPIGTREAPVEKLLWRIRDARMRFPNAKLSVIAHSFGTYAISKIFTENPDIQLHRLILCGAILPSDFRWDQIRQRVESEVINDCGTRDIWPVLAQSTTFGYGPSGRFGFGTPGVRDRFHDFGHGGFFQDKFVREFWLPWFRKADFVRSTAPSPSGARWHLLTIFQIKWMIALLFVFGIVAGYLNKSFAVRAKDDPQVVAERFLSLVDQEHYQESWSLCDKETFMSAESWLEQCVKNRNQHGVLKGQRGPPESVSSTWNPEHMPPGHYSRILYDPSFVNFPTATETVDLRLASDGHWKICGYYWEADCPRRSSLT